jgi:Fe-S-cluster containining protein
MIPRNCNFCGLCCTLVVKVTKPEIENIESAGYDRKDFTEKDDGGNTILKRPNGWCYFFEKKHNVGYCKIYDKRPSPCKDFPAKPLCDLRDNVIFQNMDNKHPNVKALWKNAPKKTDPLPKEEPKFPDNS